MAGNGEAVTETPGRAARWEVTPLSIESFHGWNEQSPRAEQSWTDSPGRKVKVKKNKKKTKTHAKPRLLPLLLLLLLSR